MSEKTLGLYLHIPFCVRKCAYCDFLSFPAEQETMAAYTEGLIREIRAYGARYGGRPVDTVYFGGGTPSLLPPDLLAKIWAALFGAFRIIPGAEVTAEVNPGTLPEGAASFAEAIPVTRVSIGLQSDDPELMEMLGRIHRFPAFLSVYEEFGRLGITDRNVDLMFGLPGQTLAGIEKTLRHVLELSPSHVSAYSLMVEEGTPIAKRIAEGGLVLPPEDTERAMYHRLTEMLAEAGLRRYEISNFALPGRESRHNLRYWRREEYLGLGLGAASFADGIRYTNPRDLREYLAYADDPGTLRRDIEKIGRREAMEEMMFLGLRTAEGVSDAAFREAFGCGIVDIYGGLPQRLAKEGLMICENGRYVLTDRGIDISNTVLASFLLDRVPA